jgi:hypothetical protein
MSSCLSTRFSITLFLLLVLFQGVALAGTSPPDTLDLSQGVAEVEQLANQTEATALALAAKANHTQSDSEPSPALAAVLKHAQTMAKMKESEHRTYFKRLIIPIIAIVGFFVSLLLLVYLPIRMSMQRHQREVDLRAKAIAAGMAVVPELPHTSPKRNDRRSGILLAGLGLAVAVAAALTRHWNLAAAGVAPILLGAAYYLAGVYFGADGNT